jgi:hypothetical protein
MIFDVREPGPFGRVELSAPADMPLIDRVIQALLDFEARRGHAGGHGLLVGQLNPDLRRQWEEHARAFLIYIRNAPPVVEVAKREVRGGADIRVSTLFVPDIWHTTRFDGRELARFSSEWVAREYTRAVANRLEAQLAEPLAQALEESGHFNPRGH